jgi:hypothetical protein
MLSLNRSCAKENPYRHSSIWSLCGIMKKITSVPCHTCARREYRLAAGEVHVACEAYSDGIPAEIVTGEIECPHRKTYTSL